MNNWFTTKLATYPILCEVHVGSEDIGAGAMHLLSQKVLMQRAFTRNVVLQSDVPICTECTG